MSGSFFFLHGEARMEAPHYTVTRWQLRRLLTRQNILIADVIILPSLRLIPEPTSQRLWEKWTMRKFQSCHFTAHTATANTHTTCLFCTNTSFPLLKTKIKKHHVARYLTDAWQYIFCYTDTSHCPTQGWWTMDRMKKRERDSRELLLSTMLSSVIFFPTKNI